MYFSAHIIVLLRIIFSDLHCFILIFLKRKGASTLVISSSCVFSARFSISDIVILVFCILFAKVQAEGLYLLNDQSTFIKIDKKEDIKDKLKQAYNVALVSA